MLNEYLTTSEDTALFIDTLAAVAPGTALRDGLTRILKGETGALIVLGTNDAVEQMTGGGFTIDVEFTATRLRELAKMDGAIILSANADRILRAGVQLLPDGSLPTDETGTRHRTADRAAQQSGLPVVSVSKSMRPVALYVGGHRLVVEESAAILSRANQALATLERYKYRLDEVSAVLSALEIEDMVTARDVAAVAQRLEMVRRIAAEIADHVVELGTDGRLIALQHEELVSGVDAGRVLIVSDYAPVVEGFIPVDAVLGALYSLSPTDLLDLELVAHTFGLGGGFEGLDTPVSPRGYRLLSRVQRLPDFAVERLVTHFGDAQRLLAATIDQLQAVDGIGETRARSVRDGLSRMVESNFR